MCYLLWSFCLGQQQKPFVIYCLILSSKFWWGKTDFAYSFIFTSFSLHVCVCMVHNMSVMVCLCKLADAEARARLGVSSVLFTLFPRSCPSLARKLVMSARPISWLVQGLRSSCFCHLPDDAEVTGSCSHEWLFPWVPWIWSQVLEDGKVSTLAHWVISMARAWSM